MACETCCLTLSQTSSLCQRRFIVQAATTTTTTTTATTTNIIINVCLFSLRILWPRVVSIEGNAHRAYLIELIAKYGLVFQFSFVLYLLFSVSLSLTLVHTLSLCCLSSFSCMARTHNYNFYNV